MEGLKKGKSHLTTINCTRIYLCGKGGKKGYIFVGREGKKKKKENINSKARNRYMGIFMGVILEKKLKTMS